MIKKIWRIGDSLVATITRDEAEQLGIHEDDLVDMHIQKMELRSALQPEVKAALERAAAELAPDLDYLQDK